MLLITVSGYGHVTPKTVWGKVVTIFYAILGIPLMLLCLSHIGKCEIDMKDPYTYKYKPFYKISVAGDFLAQAFRFVYWKVKIVPRPFMKYLCNL